MDSRRSVGTLSKYAAYVPVSDPSDDEHAFIDGLKNFAARLPERPVVFPTNDNWAAALARNKEELSETCIPCVADKDVVELVINKERFSERGKLMGYSTPAFWEPHNIGSISDGDFPVLVKPKKRRDSSAGLDATVSRVLDKLRFQLCHNREELSRFIESAEAYREFLQVEKFVHGLSNAMYTVGIYADRNNSIQGLFTGRKVRGYPAEYGDCIVGEVHSVPDFVLEETARIVKDIGYSGIAEFEYKKDIKTGEWFLIEINPRSWSWIGITEACSVSLPWIAYLDLTGGVYHGLTTTREANDGSVKYVKVLQDMQNSLFAYRRTFPDWAMSYRDWRKSLCADTLVKAEFHAGDWKVGVSAIVHFVKSAMIRAVRALIR